jgi:DNA-binding transcriptional ArsR family regulator
MVNLKSTALDSTFAALSDPTRRAILARLAQGEALVGELAEPFAMSLPAVTKHLNVLEEAGLVRRIKDGRMRRCRLNGKALKSAHAWFSDYEKFWQRSLDRLEKYLVKTV